MVKARGRTAAARSRTTGARARGRRGVTAWPAQAARFCRRLRVPRRAWRVFLGAPGFLQACVVVALATLVWFALNGIYQVVRSLPSYSSP